MAATQTVFGSLGCTSMRAIDCVSRRPMYSNFTSAALGAIAFELRHTPLPKLDDCRLFASPVPTYRMLGSEGASARSPMVPVP